MKLWPIILIFLCGCKIPSGSTNSVTITCYGAMFGYDPSTHLPAMYVGLIHEAAHSVPTNAAPVTSSLSVEQHWLSANFFEEFTTGGAQIPSNSVARTRAMMVAPPKAPAVRKLRAPKAIEHRTGSNHAAPFSAQQTAAVPYIGGSVVTISLQEYQSLKSAADSTTDSPPTPK